MNNCVKYKNKDYIRINATFSLKNKYLSTCENGCSINSSAMLVNGASRNNPAGCIFSAASRANTCAETLMINKNLLQA